MATASHQRQLEAVWGASDTLATYIGEEFLGFPLRGQVGLACPGWTADSFLFHFWDTEELETVLLLIREELSFIDQSESGLVLLEKPGA